MKYFYYEVLHKLIIFAPDNYNGISIIADEPLGNPLMLNVNRPAVLRQYFGRTAKAEMGDSCIRSAYGIKLVSKINHTDPDKFTVKPFCSNLIRISDYILELLQKHCATWSRIS